MGRVRPVLALAAVFYLASKVLFGISTLLSHVSAYTILETLRQDFVRKLMKASLGTVQAKSIGNLKNVFVDRIESIEPPLAHMIPELGGSLVLAAGLAAWLVAIDWRIALACLACVPVGLAVFASSLKDFNAKYAAYMAESNPRERGDRGVHRRHPGGKGLQPGKRFLREVRGIGPRVQGVHHAVVSALPGSP